MAADAVEEDSSSSEAVESWDESYSHSFFTSNHAHVHPGNKNSTSYYYRMDYGEADKEHEGYNTERVSDVSDLNACGWIIKDVDNQTLWEHARC